MRQRQLTSCYSNDSESPYRRRRRTNHSIVFARWRLYAPPSNTWVLIRRGHTRVRHPNGILIGSAVSARLTGVPNEQAYK